MSAGLFGIAGGEQDVTDTLKDTRIGFLCKIEDDRIAIDNSISAIRVVIGHRNVASDLRKLIDHCIEAHKKENRRAISFCRASIRAL